ncbi:hypothetical protein GCM10027035_11450 [Emticicia sediminis]
MKAVTKQISEDITGTLIEVIAVGEINKKLEKTIEKSAKKIAKEVVKLRKKESKRAAKVAKQVIIKDLLSATKQKIKAPMKKVVVKKLPVVSKTKVAKLSVT